MLNAERQAAIVGVAESELGYVPEQTVLQMQAKAAKAALEEAGLTTRDVDAIYSAGLWGWAPAMTMAEYLGIQPNVIDSTQIGGASFETHLGHAAAAIAYGLCEVALITYASTQRSDAKLGRGGGRSSGSTKLAEQFEAPWGLTSPVGSYALAATRHIHDYGTTSEQLAKIAVHTRDWARLNPKAQMRDPLTVSDVLNSRYICEPLHLLDCCLVTDGGGAIVVTNAKRAQDLATTPILVLGHGEATTHASISSMPDITTTPSIQSGGRALQMAGVTHDDIDVVEIYDSFTITVLLTLESLGFCKRGEGGAFVETHDLGPDGDFPMNTNGGGLSYTHPGMYGIFLLIEATRQLRGDCGDRQVPDAKTALVNGTGGVLSSAATIVLGRE